MIAHFNLKLYTGSSNLRTICPQRTRYTERVIQSELDWEHYYLTNYMSEKKTLAGRYTVF